MKRSDMAKESEMTKNALAVSIGPPIRGSRIRQTQISISEWYIKY